MSWAARSEIGAAWASRAAVRAALRFGWPVGRYIVPPASLYYLLTARTARRASCDYLRRALGRPPGWRDLWRHFRQFGLTLFDRVFLITGQGGAMRIDMQGGPVVERALAAGGGAILLGAHLGGFEALRALRHDAPVSVRAFMFRANRGPLARLFDELSPDLAAHIIEIGAPDAMLRVQAALARGELIGMLADRAPRGERMIRVPFLGEDAAFPSGPLLVAAMLGAPVLLFHGRRTGPRRYTARFDAFAERIVLPRTDRAAALRQHVARYAAWLEDLCRAHPYDWFNFYDFWSNDPAPVPRVSAAVPAANGAGR